MNDKSKNILLIAPVIAMFLIYSVSGYFIELSSVFNYIVLSIIILVSALLLGMTALSKDLYQFSLQSYNELLKVVWPTRQETIQTTVIVVIMVAVMGFILWAVDSLFLWVVSKVAQIS